MARKPKNVVKVEETSRYVVTKKLEGEINNRVFKCQPGEVLELLSFEANILKAYIKEE